MRCRSEAAANWCIVIVIGIAMVMSWKLENGEICKLRELLVLRNFPRLAFQAPPLDFILLLVFSIIDQLCTWFKIATAAMACRHPPGLFTKCNALVTRSAQASTRTQITSIGARYASSSGRFNRNQADEERTEEARAMERNFTRDWKVGDVYAPHDLSAAEARKWRTKKAPTQDAFDVLSINPLDVYKVGFA